MKDLLFPHEETFTTLAGTERKYVLSKFPCIAGREIVAGYPMSAVPKLSDYKANEAIMLTLMSYVAVNVDGGNQIRLATRDLVENHVPDYETLVKIEIAMMRYNTSFFGTGTVSTFLKGIIQTVPQYLSPMLIPLLEQLSTVIKQRLKNSEKTTL